MLIGSFALEILVEYIIEVVFDNCDVAFSTKSCKVASCVILDLQCCYSMEVTI